MKEMTCVWGVTMVIKHNNYYGLDHKEVKRRFGAEEYLGDTCIDGESFVSSIYRSMNPDREKGHKDIIFLSFPAEVKSGYIRGKNLADIEDDLTVDGINCINCDDIIYSPHRHAMVSCTCGETSIDGGREYIKVTGNPKDYRHCTINLVTQEVRYE